VFDFHKAKQSNRWAVFNPQMSAKQNSKIGERTFRNKKNKF